MKISTRTGPAIWSAVAVLVGLTAIAVPSFLANRRMGAGRDPAAASRYLASVKSANAAAEKARKIPSPLLVYLPVRPNPAPAIPPLTQAIQAVPAPGTTGPGIALLEQRLTNLSYMTGKVDGLFDAATQHGIVAFQKVEGLPRTGQADPLTLLRIDTALAPKPAFSSPPDHLEVDVARQVVFVVRGGRVAATLPTSTGNNKLFRSQGRTRRAVTPDGQFQIGAKMNGWRKSPLGMLYRPSYFNNGIAFHGSKSVPTAPASHGCVRLPMAFADWFYETASPPGTVVHVYGGQQRG